MSVSKLWILINCNCEGVVEDSHPQKEDVLGQMSQDIQDKPIWVTLLPVFCSVNWYMGLRK